MKRKMLFSLLLMVALLFVGCSGGTGTLVVETNPSEVEVYFQKRLVGETPLELTGLEPSNGILTLQKDGYKTKDVAVSIIAGKTASVVEQLERDQVRITKPDELIRELWLAVGSNDMVYAAELWHPDIPKQNVIMATNAMRKTMEEAGNPELLGALFASLELTISSMGYDRYLVTPIIDGETLDDSSRFMIQKYRERYVVLLPGFAFDSMGVITSLGIEFFGAHHRPDPNLSLQNLMFGMAKGDRKCVEKHTSKHTTPEVIEQLLGMSDDERMAVIADHVLILAIMSMTYPVYYIDPTTVIIGEEPGERRVMVWEDDMWKVLPHEVSYKVFSDTELPPFFDR